MIKKRKNIQQQAEWLNVQTFNNYYVMLEEYALNMFEWEGLPEEISVRYLELQLLRNGSVTFFHDKSMGGYIALSGANGGQLNIYNDPTTSNISTTTGYYKEVKIPTPLELKKHADGVERLDTEKHGVIMYNNMTRTPTVPFLRLYAERLTEVERTIDVNLKAQKTPILILTDDGQVLTLKNVYMKYDGNEPVIFGVKKGFDPDAVTVLKTDAPFVADKLMEYKHNLWNECMTFLGIGNAKQDKRERLVADEVKANDEQILQRRFSMLRAREIACEQINQLFGLNVSVKFKLNEYKKELDTEGEETDGDFGVIIN